jgi:hypothetical protein
MPITQEFPIILVICKFGIIVALLDLLKKNEERENGSIPEKVRGNCVGDFEYLSFMGQKY